MKIKFINLVLLIFFLTIIASILGYLIYIKPHFILDCSASNSTRCINRILDLNIKDCEPWFLGNKEKPHCQFTKEGLSSVTYITDPANYIPVPFTKSRYKTESITTEFNEPWDIAFLNDGSILITEKKGQIKLLKDKKISTLYTLKTYYKGLHGLMGIAVDPNFESNQYVYVLYTDKLIDDNKKTVSHKIVRLKLENQKLINETVILEHIPGSFHHSGGRLDFGPDNKLYVTVGDADDLIATQDKSLLAGKILRINTDGSIPEDNPFKNSYVFSYGHRNPQGLSWDLKTKTMYASEHGPFRFDEINKIVPGQNYGWPDYKCDEQAIVNSDLNPNEVSMPIYCTKDWTAGPSGIEFVNDDQSPWNGSLFIAMLRGQQIHRIIIKDNTVVEKEIFYVNKDAVNSTISRRIRDIEYYNGSLYIIGEQFGLLKISPIN